MIVLVIVATVAASVCIAVSRRRNSSSSNNNFSNNDNSDSATTTTPLRVGDICVMQGNVKCVEILEIQRIECLCPKVTRVALALTRCFSALARLQCQYEALLP